MMYITALISTRYAALTIVPFGFENGTMVLYVLYYYDAGIQCRNPLEYSAFLYLEI